MVGGLAEIWSTPQKTLKYSSFRGDGNNGLGVFSSQIGVFPSRGVSFSQIGVFGSRGVSGSQVLVFPVPGLVFSLPSSCVGVFGSQVWVFSVLDNVFPARLLCWYALSRVCLSAFV